VSEIYSIWESVAAIAGAVIGAVIGTDVIGVIGTVLTTHTLFDTQTVPLTNRFRRKKKKRQHNARRDDLVRYPDVCKMKS